MKNREGLEITVKAQDIFKMLMAEIRRHRWLFLLTSLGVVFTQIASLLAPLYMRQLFNILAAGDKSPMVIQTLIVLVLIIGGLAILGWVFRRMQTYGVINFESRAMTDLYDKAFDYLIDHSYRFFISNFSGTLTRRVSKYAHAFEALMDSLLLEFLPMTFFVVGAVGILFLRNHILGIVIGVWVIVFTIFQIWTARLKQPLRIARTAADSNLVGVLSDAISNQSTITLFSGGKYERGLFARAVERWRFATMHSWNTDEIIWAVQDVLIVGINIGVLWGMVILWRQGSFTIGDFVLVQSYLLGLFNQLSSINRNMRHCYDAIADTSEMMEIMKLPHEIADRPNASKLIVKNGEIVLDNVGFYYSDDQPTLKNLSLEINPGEKLAFVGPSGSGKTTITKLLLRLYDTKTGAILIDGQNIKDVKQESLRNAIAFVPQEPILFHRTLMENIRYGRRDASNQEVFAAAKAAHCTEFIKTLPHGYDTLVGERGIKLSGGERQRIAIARAILKNAPILVLDEATSSLDSNSEALIQDALQKLMKGKTVIVIAHRLSTIMKMDRIVVIEKGRIVAEGTHQDLLKQGGLYEKLWSIQAGSFGK